MSTKESNRLKDKFIHEIQRRIFSGEYKPGDKLPPERQLAEQMGISRSCINQGILDLERAGFLRIAPRKGTFVAQYIADATPQTMSALMHYDSDLVDEKLFRDLMDMRILIECECVRLACKHITIASVRELSERTIRLYTVDRSSLPDALYQYHFTLVRMSGNAAYSMIFQSYETFLKTMIETHYSNDAEVKKCLPLYEELTLAISDGNSEEADRMIKKILHFASYYMNIHLKQR